MMESSAASPNAAPAASVKSPSLALDVALAMREEANFLQSNMGIHVAELKSLGSDAVLRLPAEVKDKDAVKAFMAEKLPGLLYFPSGQSAQGTQSVTVDTFNLRHTVKCLQWPLGRRAQPELDDAPRMHVENEFRRMLGVPLRSALAENEDLLHKEYKEAMAALKLQAQIGFGQYMQHGRYVLPVIEKGSAAEEVVTKAHEYGLLNGDDAKFITTEDGQLRLDISPEALQKTVNWVAKGLEKDGTVLVASVETESMNAAREAFAREQRIDLSLKSMNQAIALKIAPAELARIREELGLSGVAQKDEVLSRELTKRYDEKLQGAMLEQEKNTVEATPYDPKAMLLALSKAQKIVDEPRYWKALDRAQMMSKHNQLRAVLTEDIADLQQMLSQPDWSQAGLKWLVNESGYNESLRTVGHLMQVLDINEKGGSVRADQQVGAKDFATAFQFTPMAMRPKSAEGKQASYYLRSQLGRVSFGEKVKRNAFMGIQPIIHSLEPAKDKPLLVGGIFLGLVVFSAVVPKKFSPYYWLNKMMHDMVESFQKQSPHGDHDHGAGKKIEKLEKQVKDAEALVNKVRDEKGPLFKQGVRTGYSAGMLTAAGGFIAWNVVEDIIVHVPLALISVTVGFIGAGVGKKVLAPMFYDIGDIAGKFLPDTSQAIASDYHAAKNFISRTPIQQVGSGLSSFYNDVDEMGVVATTRHTVDQVTHAMGNVMQGLNGEKRQKTAGRAMA